MSLYEKATLVQIPSGYKAADAKLYSVVPNTTAGDFTVNSDADATRVNKDGLIETTVANQARLNYNFIDGVVQPDPHLLLEPSRQNDVTNSVDLLEYFNNTTAVTETSNATTSPDGSVSAYKYEGDGSSTSIRLFENRGFSENTTYSLSVFAKAGTNNFLQLGILGVSGSRTVFFDLSTATASSEFGKIENYGNGWYRCSITADVATGDLSGNANIYITKSLSETGFDSNSDAQNATMFLWGAQLEEGSYSTSLIPTSGSAVTRTEDNCYINSGLQDILNTSEGTLFVDVEVPRVSSTGSFERITLSDQNASTDRILFDNFAGNWRALMLSTAGNVNKTIVSVTANQRIKVAIAYSSTELRISYDGNTATTTSGSYTPTTTLESFKFSNKDGGSKWQGKIYQVMYFDTALTNSELKTLTS